MLKACSISYTVNLVTPCVCVRGTVDKILGHGKYFEVGICTGTISDFLNSYPNVEEVQKNTIC